MKTTEVLTLLAKLWELETIAQTATTPEGRWLLLQNWLKENPKWKKQINFWVGLSPDAAYLALKDYIAEQAEIPSILIEKYVSPVISGRVIAAIRSIQACYRERKQVDNQTRKEIAK